jgi:hypothetical protein
MNPRPQFTVDLRKRRHVRSLSGPMIFIHLFKPVHDLCSNGRQMVTAMLMVYLNLSKSASLPLGLLGRLDQRVLFGRWPVKRKRSGLTGCLVTFA